LGGVKGALEKQANQVYETLSTEEKAVAKCIFLELTQLGEGTEDTRRRVWKRDLINEQHSESLVNRVIGKLADARLLVTDEIRGAESEQTEVVVDVAHEALIRHWARLRQWIEENREAIRIERKVESAAKEWNSRGKGKPDEVAYLLQGSRLREAQEYLEKYLHLGHLNQLAQEFIQESQAAQERFEAEKDEQVRALNQALTESKLREQSARVVNLLPVQPLDAVVLAIQTMGLNLDQLPEDALSSVDNLAKYPGKILGSVQASLRQAMETVRVPKTLGEHEGSVRSVAFSPDGKWIVSGSDDKTVCLWDIQGNAIAKSFHGHEDGVTSVAFSPDGKWIVSGSDDQTVRLWDIKGNAIAKSFHGHEDGVTSVAFSPDGKLIVSCSEDKTVRLWDIQGNPIGETFLGHEKAVTSVAFSPDGEQIVSCSEDKTVRLWDTEGNLLSKPFAAWDVSSVAFSPDGKLIVSGSMDATLYLWNTKGKLIGESFQHKDSVHAVAFSPDGEQIVSGCRDKTLSLWDTEGNLIGQPFIGHEDYVNAVAFSPDGKLIVSGSDDKTVRLWDTENNPISEPLEHKKAVYSVAFSPDGKLIVSGGDDVKTLLLWDTQGNFIGKPLWKNEGYGCAIAFSPDGQMIVSASYDMTMRLWNIEYERNLMHSIWAGHQPYSVNAVAFSPDGQMIVSCSGSDFFDSENIVRLWDIQGNPIGQPFRGHKYAVRYVAFSPDGQMVVSCSGNRGGLQDDNTVRLWDLSGNQIGKPFRGHESSVNAVAFSPDGQMIVSCSGNDFMSRDNTVRLWDLQGNQIGEPFQGHEEWVTSVAISPDGKLIVSGSSDTTVRLWRGGWQTWLEVCCNRLRYHPVFKNPQTEVEKQACETCQKYVWSREES